MTGGDCAGILEMTAIAAGLPAPVPGTREVPGSGSLVPGPGERRSGNRATTTPSLGRVVPHSPEPTVPGSGDTAVPGSESRLGGWQKLALAVTVALAVALFAYGAAGSYTSVAALAARHLVPLPSLVPIGVDGSLTLAVSADIVLTWVGHPIWWLRAAARGFIAGSVAANAAAGWPDPISVFLHCFPPAIVLLITEAGRKALLREHQAARRHECAADGSDPIPLARWLAAPVSTLAMWRRMALWGVKSYAMAVTAEVTRRQAIVQLRMHYGNGWRREAPCDLVWLLRTGNRLEEACARVAVLTSPEPGTAGTRPSGTGRRGKARAGSRRPGNQRAGNHRPGTGNWGTSATRNQAGNHASGGGASGAFDPALLADVRRRIAEHRARYGRELTVAELAIALGRRKTVAGQLMRAARAEGQS